MKRRIFGMYGERDKRNKIDKEIEIKQTISKTVGKGISGKIRVCLKEMVCSISARLKMGG